MPQTSPAPPAEQAQPELCGATWWNAAIVNGERVVVNHRCGKRADATHGFWHTCRLHGTPERMGSTGAQRVQAREQSG